MSTINIHLSYRSIAWLTVKFLAVMLLLVFAIDLMTRSMVKVNDAFVWEIFEVTSNPFVGLFIGLVITAMVQSSSTITAMIVALVAAGNLSLEQAVPLVMGANIGTSITSTLVSLTYITNVKQFKRAFAAGVSTDIYNILLVTLLFPLEYYLGWLSKLSQQITQWIFMGERGEGYSHGMFTRPISDALVDGVGIAWLTAILGLVLLFVAIRLLSNTLFKGVLEKRMNGINKHLRKHPVRAMSYGLLFTIAVQSSTVTTSLCVPVVANKKTSLKSIFPFIIGANVGTTVTAAIAALYKTEAAISIALMHVLFNIVGALLFMVVPKLRDLPVWIAQWMGKLSLKTRFIGFIYILLTFFVVPFLLIYLSKLGVV